MHSSKGAFSETVYIYGNAISATLAGGLAPSFLSLGLGLGYNELLTTALLLQSEIDLSKVRGESYELVSELNENFKAWLNDGVINEKFKNTYAQIVNLCAQYSNQEPQVIKTTLAELVRKGQWILHGPITHEVKTSHKISCFLFDAFSSKTSPELWTEEFITSFLKSTAAERAVLATYACTGTLKRGLQRNGFAVTIREGFAGKRESTFASRGMT